MTWVVDASVAVKWFVEENGSSAARRVLASGHPLIAPDLIVPEFCNTAWKKIRRGEISREHGEAMLRALSSSLDRLLPTAPLSQRALELARRFDHPAYDCFYLALAEAESANLITDDQKLIALGKRARLARRVKALASFERKAR